MGEVYKAQDTSEFGRIVALKILPAEVGHDKQRMQRFIQEAQAKRSRRASSPLSLLKARPLCEYISKPSGLKLREVLEIAIQIVAALDAAHEAKVIHRDIKPENIMLRRRDHIVKGSRLRSC